MDSKQLKQVWGFNESFRRQQCRNIAYYDGVQDILKQADFHLSQTPSARIVSNLIRLAVDQQASFLLGTAANYTLNSGGSSPALDYFNHLFKKLNVPALDLAQFESAMKCGYAVERIDYSQADDEIKVTSYNPADWQLFFHEGRLMMAIYHVEQSAGEWDDEANQVLMADRERFYVYGQETYEVFERQKRDLVQIVPPTPNPYGLMNINVLKIGQDPNRTFVDEALISLQDAINTILSTSVDDIQFNVKALLKVSPEFRWFEPQVTRQRVVSETGQVTQEEVLGPSMADYVRHTGMIPDQTAEFIQRGNDQTLYEWSLKELRRNFMLAARIADLEKLSSIGGAASGVAIQSQFQPQIIASQGFSKYFQEGLRNRVKIINQINSFLGRADQVLEDFDITFNFSMPSDAVEILKALPQDLLSRQTLIGLVPNIDPAQEIERKAQENTNSSQPVDIRQQTNQ